MSTIKYFAKIILYQPLFNALIFLAWLVPGHNVGWAIILLTIIIRLALWPSSMKSIHQQKKNLELAPERQKITEKYKDDRQKQFQELMAFNKKHGLNPLGSCLPLLIQLPILIILFYVFKDGLNTSHFYLLYPFTPRPDDLKTTFLGINLAQPDPFWILPIVAGILQFIQGRQIMRPSQIQAGGGQEKMQLMVQKQMIYLMPLMTVFIARSFVAALPLYWIVTSAVAIFQQWLVFRKSSKPKIQMSNEEIGEERKLVKRGVEVTVRRKTK